MWSRRIFLRNGGLGLLALGAAPRFLARTAFAATGGRRVLVTIFQRGAMDGLAAVPPLDNGSLRRLRPRLAMTAARSAGDDALIDLDNGFGLHPALAPLEPLWRSGELALVHAVGSPHPTRSHFDAQDYMETGTPGRKGTPSGWLNRAASQLEPDASPLRALATTTSLPRSLYGPAPAVAIEDLDRFRLRSDGGFEELYRQSAGELLQDQGAATFEAVALLEDLRSGRSRSAADYPGSELGSGLKQIAALIKADLGLEIAFTESEGWDTHVGQGAARGAFARPARDLASSIAAFWADLGPHRDRVVLLTMTEFGRTVAENGSGGTDHGHGSCLFVLGRSIDGGRVHGSFPGLDRDQLYEGRDLPVTTDFRAVFSELAAGHLGVTDTTALFPGWVGSRLPLIQIS